MFFKNRKKKKLVRLIEEGVIIEEDFITLYVELLREEEFLAYFQENRKHAEQLLKKLVDDSKWHKTALGKVKKKFV